MRKFLIVLAATGMMLSTSAQAAAPAAKTYRPWYFVVQASAFKDQAMPFTVVGPFGSREVCDVFRLDMREEARTHYISICWQG